MKRLTTCLAIVFLNISNSFCQSELLTVAERSDFRSTSAYTDVISFINSLDKSSPYLRVESIGRSIEGHDIPLMILGNPLPASPEEILHDNRIVIYIQANIHADEVEGKEAALMFCRDILKDPECEAFKNIVFLICPVFNTDGNEKISPLHRTYQNGPVNGVGIRYNGQSLDLNRDAMKAESPELRGLITNVFNKWDPAVFMDCHTTNGSFHVEPVTFTWMPNPNGDTSLIGYMHRKMMPEISATLLKKYHTENCYYGEFIDMLNPSRGWIYESSEPRYLTNYYGLRNRLAILNENYVYADFKSRVYGCYNLMWSLSGYITLHRSEIKNRLKEADKRLVERGLNPGVNDSLGIEFNVRSAGNITIQTYEAELTGVVDGWSNYKRTDRQINVTVPYLIDYFPSRKTRFPYAYILAINDPEVIDLLKIHGIRLDRLAEKTRVTVDRFEVSELKAVTRPNQGHYTNTIKGSFKRDTLEFGEGTIVVRMLQPLANVASYLLEPQSDDGLMKWNFLDRYLVPQWGSGYNVFPVYKVIDRADIITRQIEK
jgi:murein tripeptide amidase MpaA